MSNDELAKLQLTPAPTQEELRNASVIERFMVQELQHNSAVTANTQQNVMEMAEAMKKIESRHEIEDVVFRVLFSIGSIIIGILTLVVAYFICHLNHWLT